MRERQMEEKRVCSEMRPDCAAKFGALEQWKVEIERRCYTKESQIRGLLAYQNRAIGYAAAVASLVAGGIAWLIR